MTLAEFARSLRGFGMTADDLVADAREVVDQTGLTGVYDFELNLGFLPLAAIAIAHSEMALDDVADGSGRSRRRSRSSSGSGWSRPKRRATSS